MNQDTTRGATSPPVVAAREVRRRDRHGESIMWEITCPWCHEIHTHGRGEGHRFAHCRTWTDGMITGYVVRAPESTS